VYIREAQIGDELVFNMLFLEYLEDQYKRGNDLVPDEKTMDFITGIFEQYVTGTLDGIVLLADEEAVLMWGEAGPPVVTNRHGRVAQGWGTYVRAGSRGVGLSSRLRTTAKLRLKEMGFDAVLAAVLKDSSEAAVISIVNAGLHLYAHTGVISLRAV